MTITELIQHVGEENVLIQRIDESITGCRKGKSGISIMCIETNQFSPNDLLDLTNGQRPKMHGLILWLPTDKLPKP